MFQRVVCFKFKEGTDKSLIQQHMDSFAKLEREISCITSYRGGQAVSGDHGKPAEYDAMHYLTFQTMEDIDEYFHHPAHKVFIQENKEIWDRVFVLNSSVDV